MHVAWRVFRPYHTHDGSNNSIEYQNWTFKCIQGCFNLENWHYLKILAWVAYKKSLIFSNVTEITRFYLFVGTDID